jgi:hypothetical protein
MTDQGQDRSPRSWLMLQHPIKSVAAPVGLFYRATSVRRQPGWPLR